MNRFLLSVSSRLSFLIAGLFLSAVLCASEADILRAKADKDFNDGNFKDAYATYRILALGEETNKKKTGYDLQRGLQCLGNLGKNNEIDSFREDVIAKNQENWLCLKDAAETYINSEHFGFMIAGKFERGSHRGGGEIVNAEKRDHARALQLFFKAMPLAEKEADAYNRFSFFRSFASAILFNRGYSEAWRFQYLSDISTLPDYEPGYGYHYGGHYGGQRGAPVDENGNPVYYKIPETLEKAANDGERWRWLLEAAKKSYPRNAPEIDCEFAGFLKTQFGVQTMAYYGSNSESNSQNGPYSVHTLKDDETIAKLATGIKRFTLPDEFNYIKIYEKIAELGKLRAENALSSLSEIYMNRRQYDRAVKYLEENIKRYGPGHGDHKKKTLAQITGNWGIFENVKTQSAGKPALFDFKFRNAKEISFEAYKINVKELLDDVKSYLKSNPRMLKWEKINLNDIGYRLVYENETKYLGEKVTGWKQKLEPAAGHFDKVATFETPFSEAGAYLLKGTLENGNTSRVIIWLADTVIAQKQMNEGMMYFVADASSGKPLPNVEIDFFGYHQKYLNSTAEKLLKVRQYDVLISEFSGRADENGIACTESEKLLKSYQWLVTAKTTDGRFAFMGFNGVWYGRYYDAQYNQRKVYCVTDRPVYRPGQKLDFKFWIRHAKYDQENTSDFANMPFTVIIKNPKREEIFKKTFTSDSYAGINGEFELPKDASLGNYSIYIENWGGSSFRVEEYKKPEYEVKVDAPAVPVSLGDKITATIKAKYYFGAPVTNATVKYKVQRYDHSAEWYPPAYWDWFYNPGYWWFSYDYTWYPGWARWGCVRPCAWWLPRHSSPPELVMDNEAKISPDGTVKIEIDTAVAKALFGDKDSRYEITAEVIDQSRRTIVGKGSVIAAREPFKVYCWVNSGYYKAGDTVGANFNVRTVDGKGVKGFGDLKLIKIKYDAKGLPVETVVQTWKLDTDERGCASLKIKASEMGQYRLSYTVTDAGKHSIEGAYVFTVRGGKEEKSDAMADAFRFNAIELINDKTEYAPGDKLALMVNTEQKDSTVLLFIRPCNGIYLKPKVLRLDGKSAFEKIEVIKKDMPNFFIEAMTVSNGKIHTAVKEIIVPPEKKVLNVEVLPSKKKYKPGEKAEVKLKVTDYFGKPITSSIVVSVYDKSVEYISGGSNVPEIKAFFWKWRRTHHENLLSSLKTFTNLLRKNEVTLGPLGVFGGIVSNEYGMKADLRSYRSKNGQHLGGGGEAKDLSRVLACKSSLSADAVAAPACAEKKENVLCETDAKPQDAADAPEDAVTVRKNFADTAYWSVTLSPDENGEAKFEIPMPESLTTWKIKAWSLTGGTKVGQGETEVITSKDFLIRMETPRFFVETDEVVLSAIVHNYLPAEKKAEVILELGGDSLSMMTDKKRSVSIKSNGETRVDWKVKAVKEGEAVITMKALTDGDGDAMQMKFPVLVHGIMKTVSYCGNIRAGESADNSVFTIDVPEKRRTEESRLEINYSPTLAGAMLDALPYLIAYPYGCTEQTLNRFLPAVVTRKVLREMGISLAQIKDKRTNLNAQEIGGTEERAAQWKRFEEAPVFDEKVLNDVINDSLKRLEIMQLSDGGWGWFSGYGEYSYPHTTALIVHGLQTARANDLKINPSMMSRGIEWLKRYQTAEIRKLENFPSMTEPYKEYADNIDAFVYMVLVDEGIKNEVMMNFLYRDRTHISVYGMSMLGIALNKQKETEKLNMLMKNIGQYLVEDDENQTAYLKLPENNCWWYWYGSEYETQAYYLKLLTDTDPKGRVASRLVKYLLNNRKHSMYWNSTRDTAFCVEAFADYLRKSGEDKPDMTIEVLMDGKLLKTVSVNQENLFSFDNKVILYGNKVSGGKHKIELRRKGKGPLYFNAYLSYFTLEDFIRKAGLEIKVERNYYRLKKADKTVKTAGERGQAVDKKVEKYEREKIENMALLKSGDLVEIELVIDSKNDYEYILFEDMKAAGFEPCEVRSGYSGNSLGAYIEYRDTKVCFFVRALARGRHSVSYRMRAEIPGKFSALPTTAYGMYAPELKANSDEIKLKIED